MTDNNLAVPKVLPNGAEVIRVFYDYERREGVVMARKHEKEWITWQFYREDLRSTSCGHYLLSYELALGDFMERVSRVLSAAAARR